MMQAWADHLDLLRAQSPNPSGRWQPDRSAGRCVDQVSTYLRGRPRGRLLRCRSPAAPDSSPDRQSTLEVRCATSRTATSQVHGRRKPPGGDSAIQRGAGERGQVQHVAKPKVRGIVSVACSAFPLPRKAISADASRSARLLIGACMPRLVDFWTGPHRREFVEEQARLMAWGGGRTLECRAPCHRSRIACDPLQHFGAIPAYPLPAESASPRELSDQAKPHQHPAWTARQARDIVCTQELAERWIGFVHPAGDRQWCFARVRGRCFECVLYGHRRRPHRMDHDEHVGQTLPRTQREKSGKKQPEGHARILRASRSRTVSSRKACHWMLLRPQRRDRIQRR